MKPPARPHRRPRGRLVAAVLIIAALLVPALLSSAAGADTATTTEAGGPPVLAHRSLAYTFTVPFGGATRDYRLYVPPAAAKGKKLALVLNLHGATQNANLQELQSGMDRAADKDGYFVVYPNGTRIATTLDPDPVAGDAEYGWNAGACCGLPIETKVDDVGFLLKVIADAATRAPIDLRRVYVTGMSNGGMMAYTMAAKASKHIAAVASVEGQVQMTAVHPARPVPTLEFHSVDDPIAKWAGVENANPALRYSVLQGIRLWVKADGCSATPKSGTTIHEPAGPDATGETATLLTYPGCKPGSEVALWKLTGSGHVWPGSVLNTGAPSTWVLDGVGRGTVVVDANTEMWKFFRRYSLPKAP